MTECPPAARNSTSSFYRRCPSSRERRLQGLFLGLVERAAHHRAVGATQRGEHLVRRHLADQQEEGGIARLQCSRCLPHEVVVDAEIGQPTPERAGSSTNGGTGSGIMNSSPISEPHSIPDTAPCATGWKS